MKTHLRRFAVLLICVFVGTGAWLLARSWWRQREADVRQRVLDVLPQVAQRIKNFHRVKVENGRKVWEVAAREAQYDDQQHVAVVLDPLVSFFFPDGGKVGLRGREGRVFLSSRDLQRFELNGAIEAEFGAYAFRAETAHYERAENRIVSPGSVEIVSADFDLRGDGMAIEMSAQRLTLGGNVRMILRPGT